MDSIAAHRTDIDSLFTLANLGIDTLIAHRTDLDSLFALAQIAIDSAISFDTRLDSLEERPEAFSYDASLAGIDTTGTANNSVYYLQGNLVLYGDSTDAGKNYTITVVGENLNGPAKLYAENTAYTVGDWNVNGAGTEATFKIGYADIDNLVACTDGVVRATLVIDGKMTGLHLFFDIVAP
jgi:hypothetical protein